MNYQLIFFGSSPFSVTVLEKLLSAGTGIGPVVTTPDAPAGRHLRPTPNPVKLAALKQHLPVIDSLTDLTSLPLPPGSVGLVAAYGKIIPRSILDKFSGRIYNIHPSLLPKYRGPSPLQQQILDGITDTGVTLFQLDSQMDHGPVVAQAKDVIRPVDTWLTLGHRLFSLGADLFIKKFTTDNLQPTTEQNHHIATYTRKLARADGFIPWGEFRRQAASADPQLARKLRAYADWPGVWTTDPAGRRLKLVSINPAVIQYAGKTPQPFPPLLSSA